MQYFSAHNGIFPILFQVAAFRNHPYAVSYTHLPYKEWSNPSYGDSDTSSFSELEDKSDSPQSESSPSESSAPTEDSSLPAES